MEITILMLVLSLVLILVSCAVFVNAIECLGNALGFHQGIIGSILAAVGTALPETIIPIIAIVFQKEDSAQAVGIGSIVGAPFMLSTLAFFVTGMAVLVSSAFGKRTIKMSVNNRVMSKDLLFFIILYGIAIMTSFINTIIWVKIVITIILFLSYLIYLRLIIQDKVEMIENVESLYLKKYVRISENNITISIQVFVALILIVFGAYLFIEYVEALSAAIGFSPLLLSLIITPIATELPEKINSILWIVRKKDTLAIGNITGAMVYQSCIPVAIGMIFTEWKIRGDTLVSALLALGSGTLTLLLLQMQKNLNPFVLLIGGIVYATYIFYVFAISK
jgi:cation:H+ antiporter